MTAASPTSSGAGRGAGTAYPSARVLELERASRPELDRVFQRGVTPDLGGLVGWEFRGVNTQFVAIRTSAWAKWVGIKKFTKGFFRDHDGQVHGYNVPIVQGRLDDAWVAKPDDHAPRRFGFFLVTPVDPSARDNASLHALLLDYGRGGNKPWDPSRGLRDYVVQVDADNPDVLLGRAFYAVGPARLETNFFILERHRRGLTEYARR